ncbi:MAG: helix-turn-helix domain-containing protein [Planctomycetes bacterium]|nr:helix-turn-helix domain-containing protein [Planctomycetota bacterium]
MPTIIRHALSRKVATSDALRQFKADFALITGLQLDFMDEVGQDAVASVPTTHMCQMIHKCDAGRSLCASAIHRLSAHAKGLPEFVTCDAGLHEAVVPVRVSGINVGFLRFAGFKTHETTDRDVRRAEHLLRKANVSLDQVTLAKCLASAKLVSISSLQAYLRIVALWEKHLALEVTAQLAQLSSALPEFVAHAVRAIRKRALLQNLNLSSVARECGVSPSHLSRIFHHATGLTFREYMARFRIEHARNLLHGTNRRITEIALDSGFQSLSQFNRVFRQVYGKSPRQLRAQNRIRQRELGPARPGDEHQ